MKKTIALGDQPSAKQIKEIEEASRREPYFDEESPEFTYEEMVEMLKSTEKHDRKKEIITLRLSPAAIKKAKAVGKGYTGFLSRLLENALNDKDLVTRSL
ncbi:antitoxin [Candidatus Saccharibacteria bacterium]|nr:antitoxin [Candidatus Saccharibacteria bacterium]